MQIAVFVERIDQCGDDLPVPERQVEERKLRVEMVAKRIGRDLLRQEGLVVLVAAAGGRAPVSVATHDKVGSLRRALVGAVTGLLGGGRSHRSQKVARRAPRLFFIGLLEQWILLQQPLDFGVQFERRELQQPDRLLELRGQREMLAEFEL